MKTKRFTNYLKLGALLFGISILLWNCEKEEFIENQQQDDFLKAKIVLNSKIPSYIDKYIGEKTNESYKAFIGREEIYLLNTSAKTVNEKALGIINRAKAVVVENEKNTKYTFSILPYNYNENVMINLVVVDTGDGNILEYFIKFQFENIHTMPRIASSGALDMSQFSGEITYYNSDGNEFGNKKATQGRTISKSGSTNPCPGPTGGGLDDPNGNGSPDENDTSGSTGNGDGDPAVGGGGGGTSCPLTFAWGVCGNNGNADGHGATGGRCIGSPLVVTDCYGASEYYYRSTSSSKTTPLCGGNTGVIVDINIEYTKFLMGLDNDLQMYISSNIKKSDFIEQFLENNKDAYGNYTTEAKNWAIGQVKLEIVTQNIPWQPSIGTIAGLKYTHTHFDGSRGFYKLENGSIIVNSSSEQELTASGDLRDKYNDFNPNDKYYYIKTPGSFEWAEMLFNPDNLSDGLANLFRLGAIDLGKSLGRYVVPIEDLMILIDGQDFDGQEVSRIKAAGFLLLAIIPGTTALKIVRTASGAIIGVVKLGGGTLIVDTVKYGLKIITDNNVIKILSNGDEIANVVNKIMTFKYNGFGGNIITNPNKTTTVIGKWTNGTEKIINAGLSKSGKNVGGINALNVVTDGLTDDQIWNQINKPWLDKVIQRGDVIRIISDHSSQLNLFNNGVPSFFKREIDYLISKGYRINGNFIVK